MLLFVVMTCFALGDQHQQHSPSHKTDNQRPYQRKNSASRLITSCHRYLSRRSSESSVSPVPLVSNGKKKFSVYDGDVETSDSGDVGQGSGSSNGARAKIKELTRSLKHSKPKHRAKMNNNTFESAGPAEAVSSPAAAVSSPAAAGPTNSPPSSPTYYQTADNSSTSESTDHNKKVRRSQIFLIVC